MKIFKENVQCNNKPILGRWKAKSTKKQEEVFAFYANSDHCGDAICGNPIENKKLIKQNLIKMGIGNDSRCEVPSGKTNHQDIPANVVDVSPMKSVKTL